LVNAMKQVLFLLLSVCCGGAFAQTCTTTINPGSSVAGAVSGAAPGSTICLNSGNWGRVTLSGIAKSNFVTIRSTTGVDASLYLVITGGTQFIRASSLTITGAEINGASTRNIAVLNSTFKGGMFINTTNFNNNNILVDGNTFSGINGSQVPGGQEGRLSINWPGGPGSVPSGVTASNNVFNGKGCSDGVQLGSYGTVVGPGNVFADLTQGSCSEHVDAIQGYGQRNSVIKGNYFIQPRVCIGHYDAASNETIEGNVFVGNGTGADGTQCVIDLGSQTNMTFRHNTVRGASMRVGGINTSGGGSGIYTDNIMQETRFSPGPLGSCTACTFTHNLFPSGGSGTNNIVGTPIYVGGLLPTSWSGWQLLSGSPGYRAASDGSDMGASIGQAPLAPPTGLKVQ
jgi:hypothetical protein